MLEGLMIAWLANCGLGWYSGFASRKAATLGSGATIYRLREIAIGFGRRIGFCLAGTGSDYLRLLLSLIREEKE